MRLAHPAGDQLGVLAPEVEDEDAVGGGGGRWRGARTIADFQETEMVIAPAIKTEGKVQQREQRVGMGI